MHLHLVECKHVASLAGCFCFFFGLIVDFFSASCNLGVNENQSQSLSSNVFVVGELKRLHEVGTNDLKIVVGSLEVIEDIWKVKL